MSLLADFTAIVETMKRAGAGAVGAGKPVTVAFGTVVSAAPLKIDVEQKLTLEAGQLILTRNVTDYFIDAAVSHKTEDETEHTHAIYDTYTGGGSSDPTSHSHEYKGDKRFKVLNALRETEIVLLLRMQGGQKYIVLDRLEASPDVTSGEWLDDE